MGKVQISEASLNISWKNNEIIKGILNLTNHSSTGTAKALQTVIPA